MHLDPNILGKWHKSFRAREKEKQRDKGNKLAITVVINNIFRQGCAALPLLTAAKLSQFLQLDSSSVDYLCCSFTQLLSPAHFAAQFSLA